MRKIRFRCQCPCQVRVFPTDGQLKKVDGISMGPNDWWMAVKCKKCGATTAVGSRNTLGQRIELSSGEVYYPCAPAYE